MAASHYRFYYQRDRQTFAVLECDRTARNPKPFQDRPPESDQVTPYDERHFVTQIRLLDADAAGVDWREAVRYSGLILMAATVPVRSMMRIARARWMTTTGYRDLLSRS